jgi:hypothetical protein
MIAAAIVLPIGSIPVINSFIDSWYKIRNPSQRWA